MSFLLDTDICSAYLKNEALVVGRVMLHYGGLHLSVITVGELLTWALRANAPPEGSKAFWIYSKEQYFWKLPCR